MGLFTRRRCLALLLALVPAACGTTEDFPETSDTEETRVDEQGVTWHRMGEIRGVSRMAETPTFTDEEIERIEFAEIEQWAMSEGIITEGPLTGYTFDASIGAFTDGAILDDDDGEWISGPIDPEVAVALITAYEDAHPLEDAKGSGDLEEHDVVSKTVFGSDDRVRKTTSERNNFPFSATLEYAIPLSDADCRAEGLSPGCQSTCTASLIDDRYAITGAHCVYSRRDDAWIYGGRSLANGRRDRGEVCRNSTCVNVYYRYMSPNYDDGLFSDFTRDYALLKLDSDFPGSNGFFVMSSLTSRSSIKAKRHYNYGYPADKSPFGLWGMGCDIKYVGDQRLGYKCDTSGGHSGGPVYYRNGSTRYQTAIHVGRSVSYNTGPMVGYLRAWFLSKM
ncbi:MAG: trypsin-like serine peptidase [Bradymonadia bacterium]